jgi:hypothetical protein
MFRPLRAALIMGLGLAVVAGCGQQPLSTNKDLESISKEGKKSMSLTVEDPNAKKPAKK